MGLAGLEEDARDASAVIAARRDAVKAQIDSVGSWSDGQVSREETSGASTRRLPLPCRCDAGKCQSTLVASAPPGAELYEATVRRAEALPPDRRSADVRSFLEAHACLTAAAEVLLPLTRGEESNASADQRLLAVLHFLMRQAGVGSPDRLSHPRLS